MCPNVACFCMDSEDALETSSEGGHGRPVPMQQVIIILQPIREDIMWNDTPSALPHLRHQMKRITKISKATLQFWKDDISSHQARVSITSWPETSPHLTSESNYTVHPCMWGGVESNYYELQHRQKLHVQSVRNNSKAQNMLYRSMLAQSLCIITCIYCIFSTAAQVN